MPPHLPWIEWKRKAGPAGVFFEAAPVAFVGESFALKNAHRREQTPTAQQACLARRKTHLLDFEKAVVVEHIPMDQLDLMRVFSAIRQNILTRRCPGIAILLNGVLLAANREIGVPGGIRRQKLDEK
jgi:hypothetical protein